MSIKNRIADNEFWVSNISKIDVSLADLGLTIKAQRTVNLLDKRHYVFNKEELIRSANSGSLFKKKSKIVVRKVPPTEEKDKNKLEIDFNALVPSRRRSAVKIEETVYEEFEISDDDFAMQAADLIDDTYPKK